MTITRVQIQKNIDILFIFGDNDEREGLGGMAKEFRGEPNSFGIRVKKKPETSVDAYYNDQEYLENCEKILEDTDYILSEINNYIGINMPEGIGTGLAELNTRAPNTYKFLKNQLSRIEKKFVK